LLAALNAAELVFGLEPRLRVTPCLLMHVWYFWSAARCAAVSRGEPLGGGPAASPAGAWLAQALNAARIVAAVGRLPVPPKVTPWAFKQAW